MFRFVSLTVDDITSEFLMSFHHHQVIEKKYVFANGKWEISEAHDIGEWSDKKRAWVASYLRRQIESGGAIVGAFDGDMLVGFCSVDGYLRGDSAKYANLTMLFVDDEYKRKGIGKSLFNAICVHALKRGADKLFISAVPSVETVAFYFSVGCVDAKEIISEYVDTEEDRYLEYSLFENRG